MAAHLGSGPDEAPDDETIAALESALHSLARLPGHDLDQAGMAILYVLRAEASSPRITDVAARLGIDPPAVTRKAQQLERLGLVSRSRDAGDARAFRLRLTPEGNDMLDRFQ